MVKPVAELARNFGVVEQVMRASTADASRAVQPVVIDVLPKNKFRPTPFLRTHGRRELRENGVEARKVEAKRHFGVRRYGELDLEQLAHVVAHLRQVLFALITGLRCER